MDKPVEKPLRDWRKTELYAEVLRLREALEVAQHRQPYFISAERSTPPPSRIVGEDGTYYGDFTVHPRWWDRLRGWLA